MESKRSSSSNLKTSKRETETVELTKNGTVKEILSPGRARFKEKFDNFHNEIRSFHKFTPKKYSFIKSNDMFGHPIELNFNKEGSSKNTFFGGIISICLKILMMVYVGINIKRMILAESDDLFEEKFL